MNRANRERGSVWALLLWLFIAIVIVAGAYLLVLKLGWAKAPDFIASLPGISSFLPQEEIAEDGAPVELSREQMLRDQLIVLNSQYAATQATIATLEAELAEKDRLLTQREDEIARLTNTLKMGLGQNISAIAAVHEAMDPEDSSVILSNLTPEEASQILGAMRESKAADILALMDEQLATQITSILAGFEGEAAEAIRAAESAATETPVTGPPVTSDRANL